MYSFIFEVQYVGFDAKPFSFLRRTYCINSLSGVRLRFLSRRSAYHQCPELTACVYSETYKAQARSGMRLTLLSPSLEVPCRSVGDVLEVNGREEIALMSHKLRR